MAKIGPNEPCPCGSGKKHKKCCADAGARESLPPDGGADFDRWLVLRQDSGAKSTLGLHRGLCRLILSKAIHLPQNLEAAERQRLIRRMVTAGQPTARGDDVQLLRPYILGVNARELFAALPSASLVELGFFLSQACFRLEKLEKEAIDEDGRCHHNLKPENIAVDGRGHMFLLDARQALPGRHLYAAPEQLAGDPGDGAADVYALGKLTLCLWSGRYPKLPGEKPPEPPAAPEGATQADQDAYALLVGALWSMTSPDPKERPSAPEAAAQVVGALATAGVEDPIDLWLNEVIHRLEVPPEVARIQALVRAMGLPVAATTMVGGMLNPRQAHPDLAGRIARLPRGVPIELLSEHATLPPVGDPDFDPHLLLSDDAHSRSVLGFHRKFFRLAVGKTLRLPAGPGAPDRERLCQRILAEATATGALLGGKPTDEGLFFLRPYFMGFNARELFEALDRRSAVEVAFFVHHACVSLAKLAARGPDPVRRCHHNLKPENVCIDTWGQIHLSDARQALPGEALYAAPEQLAGGPGNTAADVYALGKLTLCLWSDRPAKRAGDAAPEPPPPLDGATVGQRAGHLLLVEALRAMTAEDPDSRPPASEIAGRMTEALETAVVGNTQENWRERLLNRLNLPPRLLRVQQLARVIRLPMGTTTVLEGLDPTQEYAANIQEIANLPRGVPLPFTYVSELASGRRE